MSTAPRPAASSKDVEKLQAEVRSQADSHTSIVDGVSQCAEGINGLVSETEKLPIPDSARESMNVLLGGLTKILQGIADIHSANADNLNRQADLLTDTIKQMRQHEAGIVIPKLERN